MIRFSTGSGNSNWMFDDPGFPAEVENVLTEHKSSVGMGLKMFSKIRRVAVATLMTSAIGIGDLDGSPCIRVFVDDAVRPRSGAIPTEIAGFPVDVEESDPFVAR